MNIEEKIELIQEGTLEIIDVDELKEKLETCSDNNET